MKIVAGKFLCALVLLSGCGQKDKTHNQIAEYNLCSVPSTDGHCKSKNPRKSESINGKKTLSLTFSEDLTQNEAKELYVTFNYLEHDPSIKAIQFAVQDSIVRGTSEKIAITSGKKTVKIVLNSPLHPATLYSLEVTDFYKKGKGSSGFGFMTPPS